MFGWLFAPTCPCDPAAKAWIEQRLQWLADEFAENAFSSRPVVLPTEEFFPDAYDGSNKAVRLLLDRVCEYMDVEPYDVTLEFVSDANKIWLVNDSGQYLPPGAAGTYSSLGDDSYVEGSFVTATEGAHFRRSERSLIRIDRSGLHDPMGLVGTMAHELAHVRLLGEGRVAPEIFDNELLTDLTVVHFGLGVFLANTPRNWASQDSKWPGTDLRKPEYMSPPMFGWALAHLAWFRDDDYRTWARHLYLGARANFRQGLRFLKHVGDSTYKPAGRSRSSRRN